MAKKRRKHRRPVAPPIHSSPSTTHGPAGPPPATTSPTRPEGAEPPPAPDGSGAPREPRRRPAPRSRAAARRRSRRRTYLIAASVVVLIVGAIVARQVVSQRQTAEFNRLATAAGCGDVERTDTSGADEHLQPGEQTTYDVSPPTHGPHAATTLAAGVYPEPLSDDPLDPSNIYRAVHSLEHGAVIVWHDGLEEDEQTELERAYRNERKVIVAPFELEGDESMALTAWGAVIRCEQASTDVADAFIDRFREARSAPEANAPI